MTFSVGGWSELLWLSTKSSNPSHIFSKVGFHSYYPEWTPLFVCDPTVMLLFGEMAIHSFDLFSHSSPFVYLHVPYMYFVLCLHSYLPAFPNFTCSVKCSHKYGTWLVVLLYQTGEDNGGGSGSHTAPHHHIICGIILGKKIEGEFGEYK